MNKIKLEELIEISTEINSSGEFGLPDIRGVANTKGFIPTKANMEGRSLLSFSIIRPRSFAFNRRTTRNGERLGLGFNDTKTSFICTEDYIVFKVKKEKENVLLPEFLFLFFLRDEFDRYVRWDSWGSATEFFNWENMCQVQISLPNLEEQKAYVASWQGLKELVSQNETLIQQLESVCHDFVIDCKYKYQKVRLGDWIEEYNERNNSNIYGKEKVVGINIEKSFIPTVADLQSTDISNYKIVPKGCFACNLMHVGRDVRIPVAYNDEEEHKIVSPAYFTFKIKERTRVLPDYLLLVFKRGEFDRLCWFSTDSSIRGNLPWSRFCDVEIPFPPVEIQRSIETVVHCLLEADRIVQKTREMMKTICPALVQKAAHSA